MASNGRLTRVQWVVVYCGMAEFTSFKSVIGECGEADLL